MEIHASFNLTYHSHYLLFLLLVSIIFLHSDNLCLGSGITSEECLEEEIQALLIFKKDLLDPSGRLSSWIGSYCCQWNGISCHNRTGHVAAIDLPNTYMDTYRGDQEWNELQYNRSFLGGKISPSLVGLKHLNYLDLSHNDFGGISIPKFFCQLKSLRYLNISGAAFGLENVPLCLGNLSNLDSLDLSWNSGFNSLPSKNLNWLSHLSALKYLHLDGMNLDSKGPSFLHAINMLPYLLELHLSRCNIHSLPLSLRALNFTSLVVLDMSDNSINSSIPQWLSNLTNLRHLDMNWNQLSGSFPSFASLKSLEYLDLSINGLDGVIPMSIGNLCKLKIYNLGDNNFNGGIGDLWDGLSNCTDSALELLDLSYNKLTGELPGTLGILQNLHRLQLQKNYMNGSIPESLGQLSKLVELDLSDNSWDGFLTEVHFINLTRLESMTITVDSNVSLSFNVSYDWIPPFKLHALQIANCRVGPGFRVWLQSQTQLTELTLRNTSISDSIPEDWFVKIASQVSGYFDLSYNQFRGTLPPQLKFQTGAIIILSHNQFEGPFPLWSTNSPVLDLESNLLSGPIPSNFGQLFPGMVELYLAENRLNGTIPPSICDMQSLEVLSLRNNQLFGEFPPRWSVWSQISIVDVSNNNLSGNIPSSMGVPSSLLVLKMNGNNFGGEIPSLKNCSSLTSIDLGENRLTGNIAHLFMGSNISVLFMLRLRSNSLSGPIPDDLCHLLYLQILDLGQNNISGTIPKCLNTSTLLSLSNSSMSFLSQNYPVQTKISTKGAEYVYNETLGLVKSIDLSSNNLEGEIPEGLTTLIALGTLNLSRNQLTGSIPSKIENLRWLETFDLSYNHLSGQILQSLASLTSLSHLNLSYNNLSGRIPVGNQLGTLENPASIYVGNPLLCGVPFSTNCPGDDTPNVPSYGDPQEPEKDENGKEMIWFYASIALGFIIGFWGVCGTLILKKSWRYAYFQFFDDVNDKVALAIASNVARLRRKL